MEVGLLAVRSPGEPNGLAFKEVLNSAYNFDGVDVPVPPVLTGSPIVKVAAPAQVMDIFPATPPVLFVASVLVPVFEVNVPGVGLVKEQELLTVPENVTVPVAVPALALGAIARAPTNIKVAIESLRNIF